LPHNAAPARARYVPEIADHIVTAWAAATGGKVKQAKKW